MKGLSAMSEGKKKILSGLAVILVVVLVLLFRGDYGIVLSFDNDIFTVDGPQGYVFSVPLEDIESVSVMDSFDRGICTEGGTKHGYSFGIWENGSGEYQLCVMDKVERFISIRQTDGGITVLNFESDESTENLYQLINDVLKNR